MIYLLDTANTVISSHRTLLAALTKRARVANENKFGADFGGIRAVELDTTPRKGITIAEEEITDIIV